MFLLKLKKLLKMKIRTVSFSVLSKFSEIFINKTMQPFVLCAHIPKGNIVIFKGCDSCRGSGYRTLQGTDKIEGKSMGCSKSSSKH